MFNDEITIYKDNKKEVKVRKDFGGRWKTTIIEGGIPREGMDCPGEPDDSTYNPKDDSWSS